ncbi:Disease resistance protein RPM1 [Zea mays]|uniref:Disease resistance protein RPM1 n=1 Tax=Zea mays TaxID=4577 RepID=A0A1D6F7Z1_MAIZE|nr:Disease resistance protein RPM1 [Zea mays]
MEGALASAATGALQSVVAKLQALLRDEYRRLTGMRGKMEWLTGELVAMKAFLTDMSRDETPPDEQRKLWMKDVRELSYDIEDSLDDFFVQHAAKPDGIMEKMASLLERTKSRHRIGKEFDAIKRKVMEADARRKSYSTDRPVAKARSSSIDPRALAIFEDARKPVGIDGAKDEVTRLLLGRLEQEGHQEQRQRQIVYIVGSGGLGKTTLAYQESDESRYFIVLDDIWDTKTWEIIKTAFPLTHCGSIIIVTTRINEVARECCRYSDNGHIYNMRPLNMEHSAQLFYGRLFSPEEKCPGHLQEISGQILEKCAGLPLAIIAMSGLLSSKGRTRKEWDIVKDSMGRALERNSDVQRMLEIISLSYLDLPPELRTCLLYLSIFPEDYTIDKDGLIKRWIGEGFIHEQSQPGGWSIPLRRDVF